MLVPHKTRPKFSAGFYAELAGNFVSPLPYFLKKYESSEMKAAIDEQLPAQDLRCDHLRFLAASVNLPENLSSPALVLFQHNVEAMIWKRHYEVQPNPLQKVYLKNQWLKTLDYEREVSDRFDLVIAVSKEDADMFRKDYGIANVIDVPTGVDIDYFRPQNDGQVRPNSLVFTGSMDWLPNEDAMQYFTKGDSAAREEADSGSCDPDCLVEIRIRAWLN